MTRSSSLLLDLYSGGPGDQWLDHSIHDNHGTLSEASMRRKLWTPDGPEIIDFDYTASQECLCGADNSLNALPAITIIAWVNSRANTGVDQAIVNRMGAWRANGYYLSLYNIGNAFKFITGAVGTDVTSGAYTFGTWVQVVAVQDGTTLKKLYINGEEVASAGAPTAIGSNTSDTLQIGATAAAGYFNGMMYRIRTLSYAWSGPQISTLFQEERETFRV